MASMPLLAHSRRAAAFRPAGSRIQRCRLCSVAQAKTNKEIEAANKELVDSLSDQQLSRARLRSEAESPFRSLRLTLFGFSTISASMGLLISFPQLAGSLAQTRGALATQDVLQNIGINLTAALVFGWLTFRDWQASQKQVARLGREEQLASLCLQLANGKRLSLGELRGSARVVMFAGTAEQVKAALKTAEEVKEELVQRGVLVVPLPIYGEAASEENAIPLPPKEDLRWRATPVRPEQWAQWFNAQLKLTKKATSDQGLYIGLRLDGRVRTSGMGYPPWKKFALQLAPLEGENAWTGFMDGFDGEVNVFK